MDVTITDLATLVLAVATTTSLIYISRQVSVTRQQTKGEFLLALDDQFSKTDALTVRMVNEPNFIPNGTEWADIWRMMSVFERMNIMVEDKILDIAMVDRLYGFRLLNVIANNAVYERLKSTGGEWQDFIDLCYKVADHREHTPNITDVDKTFVARVRTLNKTARKLSNPFGF